MVVLENYPPVFFDRNQKPVECRYQLDLEPQYRIQGARIITGGKSPDPDKSAVHSRSEE